ncbi:MAG: transposase [Desulfomonilaceae bacterium]
MGDLLHGQTKERYICAVTTRMLKIKTYKTIWTMGRKIRKAMVDRDAHYKHEPVVMDSGKHAPKLLPWVHTLLANIKGNIRGVYKGVRHKHVQRYLEEFCYRYNRISWEDQLFVF